MDDFGNSLRRDMAQLDTVFGCSYPYGYGNWQWIGYPSTTDAFLAGLSVSTQPIVL